MALVLPDFDALQATYPGAGYDVAGIRKLVGGDLDEKDVTNTCVVRVSRSLNAAGHTLTSTKALIKPKRAGVKSFHTRKGADKRWYGLRVLEFWDYMEQTYGPPTVYRKNKFSKDDFFGIRGIIGFIAAFKDANGHFTLWNGEKLLYGGEDHDYWAISTEAGLWEAGTLRTTRAPA